MTDDVLARERGMARRGVTVVTDPASADAIAPLLDHWRNGPGLRLLPWSTAAGGDPQALAELADGADAVLLVGPRARSPHTVLPGPVLTALDGRVVYQVQQLFESLTGRVQVRHLSENSFGSLVPARAYSAIKHLADWLVGQGIESMSLNPDTVVETWLRLAQQAAERVPVTA